MADIKAYRPESSTVGSGQVLECPYTWEKARLVVQEMADQLALGLVDRRLVAGQLVLTVGYDRANLQRTGSGGAYGGEISSDRYGRAVPKHAHGTINLECSTSSGNLLMEAAEELYDRIVDRKLLVRRIDLTAGRVEGEADAAGRESFRQLELFADPGKEEQEAARKADLDRERKLQETMLKIKKKYGKNAVLKGMNLQDGATAAKRNRQIGGHRA